MILTIQFQILINIGRINPIVYIICIFSPPLTFGCILKLRFDDFFHIALDTPLVCNAASKLNHWNSSLK